MAKRKQRGAAFGKQSGPASQAAMRKREQRRLGTYALFGVLALVFFCAAIAFVSGIGGGSGSNSANDDTELDTLAEGFEADSETQSGIVDDAESEFEASSSSVTEDDAVVEEEETSAETDDGFSASSSSIEAIDVGEFDLLEGDYELVELDPAQRNGYYSSYPDFVIDTDNTYEAVLVTEKGDIRLRLYDDLAPLTVNNFVALALDGYYDNTTFHRVLENFMAQAGDPTGTGTGGPGYNFEDETDNGLAFDRPGLLAMANAGPGTNGSQFFITYEPTPWLDGNHTIFGKIVEGADVLDAVRLRDPASDPQPGDLIEAVDIYVTD